MRSTAGLCDKTVTRFDNGELGHLRSCHVACSANSCRCARLSRCRSMCARLDLAGIRRGPGGFPKRRRPLRGRPAPGDRRRWQHRGAGRRSACRGDLVRRLAADERTHGHHRDRRRLLGHARPPRVGGRGARGSSRRGCRRRRDRHVGNARASGSVRPHGCPHDVRPERLPRPRVVAAAPAGADGESLVCSARTAGPEAAAHGTADSLRGDSGGCSRDGRATTPVTAPTTPIDIAGEPAPENVPEPSQPAPVASATARPEDADPAAAGSGVSLVPRASPDPCPCRGHLADGLDPDRARAGQSPDVRPPESSPAPSPAARRSRTTTGGGAADPPPVCRNRNRARGRRSTASVWLGARARRPTRAAECEPAVRRPAGPHRSRP